MDAVRVSTTYSLSIDRTTTKLLLTAPLGALKDVSAIQFVELDEARSRLLYVVPFDLDNEYVHKALQKNLRALINAWKKLPVEPAIAK